LVRDPGLWSCARRADRGRLPQRRRLAGGGTRLRARGAVPRPLWLRLACGTLGVSRSLVARSVRVGEASLVTPALLAMAGLEGTRLCRVPAELGRRTHRGVAQPGSALRSGRRGVACDAGLEGTRLCRVPAELGRRTHRGVAQPGSALRSGRRGVACDAGLEGTRLCRVPAKLGRRT